MTAEDLARFVRSGELKEKMRAVEVIGVFGSEAKAVVPDLIKLISSPPPQVPLPYAFELRARAVEAIGEIGSEASAAVPTLMTLLDQSQDSSRSAYCRALGGIGSGAKEAIPALEGLLGDVDLETRLVAAVAITKIEPERSSNAVSVLQSLQNDPELARVWAVNEHGRSSSTGRFDWQNPRIRFFRLAASVPLWRLGLQKVAPVGPILNELNRSAFPDAAYVELLGDIGPAAKSALPSLEKLLQPRQYIIVRRAAAIAIKKIDPTEAMRLGLPGLITSHLE